MEYVVYCRFIWIVLCVVDYPVDCVICCRFLWIVISFVVYPECCVICYRFPGLCYVF